MSSVVDQGFAAWLKSTGLKMTIEPTSAARWPTQGATVEVATPFATLAGATAEAERLAAFFDVPLVRDIAVVQGRRRAWLGRCIRLVHPRLGYAGTGVPVFVIGVAEQDNGTSSLTVLRPLTTTPPANALTFADGSTLQFADGQFLEVVP